MKIPECSEATSSPFYQPPPTSHFCPSDTTQPDLHVIRFPNILSYFGAKGKLYNSEV